MEVLFSPLITSLLLVSIQLIGRLSALDEITITPLTPPTTGNKVIKLGVILPKTGRYPWAAPKALPGILYAVEGVSNRTDILEGYEISVYYGDSKCRDTYGPLVAIKMTTENTANVFLGPACDYSVAPIARFSPHWNIPVISGGALVHAFQDKSQYNQLTRISGSYAKLGEFFATLFNAFNWTIPGLIYQNNLVQRQKGKTDCFFIMEAVYLALLKPFKKKFKSTRDLWNKPFDENYPEQYNMTGILKDASLNSRSKIISYFKYNYLGLVLMFLAQN